MKIISKVFYPAFFLFFIMPSYLMAFVPGGAHLMDMMVDSMGSLPGVHIEAELESVKEDMGSSLSSAREDLYFNIPKAFRSETEDGRFLRLSEGNKGFIFVFDQKLIRERANPEDLFYPLLLLRNRSMLVLFLEEAGFDMEKTALTRYAGSICYSLGDKEGNRLLIDKERLYPLLLDLVQEDEDKSLRKVSFRYRGWHKFLGSAWPSRIEFFENGRLFQVMRLDKIKKEENFKEEFFSLEKFKELYSSDLNSYDPFSNNSDF